MRSKEVADDEDNRNVDRDEGNRNEHNDEVAVSAGLKNEPPPLLTDTMASESRAL